MSEINFEDLKKPFPAEDIEWRLQSCGEKNGKIWGKALAYVTNRAIQNRLDEVVGAANWKNEFQKAPDGGILCGISIKVDGEWVTKWDGAENTQIEAVKGGLSGAMKRAASTGWGIGRYLYNLDEGWAEVTDKGKFSGKTKEGKWFNWNPPALPSWALPNGSKSTSKAESAPLSPEAEAERNKEVEDLSLKIEAYNDIIPADKLSKINEAVDAKNIAYLKTILNWCVDHANKEKIA